METILLVPLVATGWNPVIEEAVRTGIPAVFLDRQVDPDPSLHRTAVGSTLVHEGEVVGQWLVGSVGEEPCRVVEFQRSR